MDSAPAEVPASPPVGGPSSDNAQVSGAEHADGVWLTRDEARRIRIGAEAYGLRWLVALLDGRIGETPE